MLYKHLAFSMDELQHLQPLTIQSQISVLFCAGALEFVSKAGHLLNIKYEIVHINIY